MNRKLLALLAAPLIAAAPAQGITVGLVLDDTLGQTVRGWLHASGAMFRVLKHNNGVTTQELDCCIATFTRGRSYIIARTVPLVTNRDGGVVKEKIIDLRRIDLKPGEEEMGCDLFGLQSPLSVKNPKTLMVRSVVISEGNLGLLEWKDTEKRCDYEGD